MPVSPPRRRPAPLLRERSVLHGLDRRTVTEADVTAHSVAIMAPSVSALGIGFALPGIVGPGAWISVVLGIGAALAMTRVLAEFGQRLTGAGSLYTYAAKGLGAGWALVVASSLLLAYGILTAFGLTGTARRAAMGWERASGAPPPVWVEPTLVIMALVLVLVVMERGIRYSTRFALFAESVSLTVMTGVLLALALTVGIPGPNDLTPTDADLSKILLGALTVMTVTVGFECVSALAVETQRPFLVVPRATRRGVRIAGALLLVAVLLASGPVGRSGAVGGRWFRPDAPTSVLDGTVQMLLTTSFVALALSAWIALSRLVFQLSREGLFGVGRRVVTTAVGHPRAAVVVTLPVVLAPYLWTLLTGRRAGAVTGELLESATVVLFVAQALTALALVRFLRRLGELTPGVHLLALGSAAGFAVLGAVAVLESEWGGSRLPGLLLVGVVAAGWIWWAVRSRSGHRGRLGAHEETLAVDVLGTSGPSPVPPAREVTR